MRPLPRDSDTEPDRFLSTDRHPHDDVHPYVAVYLRVHRLGEAEAAWVAATLTLPMTLTMRGCVVYGTKAGTTPRSASWVSGLAGYRRLPCRL